MHRSFLNPTTTVCANHRLDTDPYHRDAQRRGWLLNALRLVDHLSLLLWWDLLRCAEQIDEAKRCNKKNPAPGNLVS